MKIVARPHGILGINWEFRKAFQRRTCVVGLKDELVSLGESTGHHRRRDRLEFCSEKEGGGRILTTRRFRLHKTCASPFTCWIFKSMWVGHNL